MRGALALSLALIPCGSSPSPARPPAAVDIVALAHVDGFGPVEVRAPSPGLLRIVARPPEGELVREVALDAIAEGELVQVELSCFTRHGLALALALRTGGATEYRYLLTHDLRAEPERWQAPPEGTPANPARWRAALDMGWMLSAPILRAEGDPYRIVDLHNHGGDTIEITFRRGWPGLDGRGLDERIFLDTCPLGGGAPVLMNGRSALVAVQPAPR